VQQYNTEDFAAHIAELAAHTLRTIAVHIIHWFFNPCSETWHTTCRDIRRYTL